MPYVKFHTLSRRAESTGEMAFSNKSMTSSNGDEFKILHPFRSALHMREPLRTKDDIRALWDKLAANSALAAQGQALTRKRVLWLLWIAAQDPSSVGEVTAKDMMLGLCATVLTVIS